MTRLVDALVAQEAVEVADPLAVEREADVRLVDEVAAERRRLVPAAAVERLDDLAVGGDLLVLPGAHPHPPAEQLGERDLGLGHAAVPPRRVGWWTIPVPFAGRSPERTTPPRRRASRRARPVSAVLFGSLAAVANRRQALISKELTTRAPARQLIGVLYLGNASSCCRSRRSSTWRLEPDDRRPAPRVGRRSWSLTAICVWDLFDHGAASATTTATAMSPIPAAIAAAVVLPGRHRAVAGGGGGRRGRGRALVALADAFAGLGRRGRSWRVLGRRDRDRPADGRQPAAGRRRAWASSRRTSSGRRWRPSSASPGSRRATSRARDVPRLLGRSVVVTAYFVCVILGAQTGQSARRPDAGRDDPAVRARDRVRPRGRVALAPRRGGEPDRPRRGRPAPSG